MGGFCRYVQTLVLAMLKYVDSYLLGNQKIKKPWGILPFVLHKKVIGKNVNTLQVLDVDPKAKKLKKFKQRGAFLSMSKLAYTKLVYSMEHFYPKNL